MQLAFGEIVLAVVGLAACAPSPTEAAPLVVPSVRPTILAPSEEPPHPPVPSAATSTTTTGPAPAPKIRARPHRPIETRCKQPLVAFCASRECPRWDAALAETMKSADSGYTPETCSGIGGGDVAVGTCGRYRFVEDGDCLSGLTRYFDVNGALTGVYAWSDVTKACGSSTAYGDVPKCP